MRTFLIFFLLCGSLFAGNLTNTATSDKRLVAVTFAADDMPPTQMFHVVATLWISETNQGEDRDISSWADQGGYGRDPDTRKKAAESLKLLKVLDEPKVLPESPNNIVTVQCLDGNKMLIKKFPIDQVPDEVHQILAIMGFSDDKFNRLKFVQRPGQAPFTNYNKSINVGNGW